MNPKHFIQINCFCGKMAALRLSNVLDNRQYIIYLGIILVPVRLTYNEHNNARFLINIKEQQNYE